MTKELVEELVYNGFYVKFKNPIDISVSYEGDHCFIRNEEFDICVWGDSVLKAFDAFNFMFTGVYKNIALEDDSKLAPGAQELKQRLLNAVSYTRNFKKRKKSILEISKIQAEIISNALFDSDYWFEAVDSKEELAMEDLENRINKFLGNEN